MGTQELSVYTPSAHGEARRLLFDGLSFRARRGESLLIMGPSGCGKTLVVQERISHIIQMSDPRQPEPRQLFIARSTPLCKQVSE